MLQKSEGLQNKKFKSTYSFIQGQKRQVIKARSDCEIHCRPEFTPKDS